VRLSSENLKEMMSGKTDQELYDILHAHSQDYTPEAIEVAKEEFHHRQLDATTISTVATAVEKAREKEDAHLSNPLRVLAFIISTVGFFIPVLLANRHFVEKGERRKAQEWARWAIYGFVFYFALGLLSWLLTSMGY
jgi:hypothetical protein